MCNCKTDVSCIHKHRYQPEFTVVSVVDRDDEYGMSYTQVRVIMQAKTWLRAKRKGQLGMLYGVDISNFLYREHGVAAYNPTVSDRARSSNGIKTLTLNYYKASKVKVSLRLIIGGLAA